MGQAGLARMKISKLFIQEKDLNNGIERLLSGNLKISEDSTYNHQAVSKLLKNLKPFLENAKKEMLLWNIYNKGIELIKEIEFAKEDIEEVSRRIIAYQPEEEYLGFYLSALVNKTVTEEDTITLKLEHPLSGIGAFLKKGKIIIEGDTKHYLAYKMQDGELIIKGELGNITLEQYQNKGKIYHWDKQVWPE